MRIAGIEIGAIEGLITANLLVFILTIAQESQAIFNQLALNPFTVIEKPWTLLTSMFVHAGFEHVLFNMIGFFFLGSYLVRLIGEDELLKVYFIGGLVGGILTVAAGYAGFYGTNVQVVGASGAVFAVAAALAILRPHLSIFIIPIPFPIPLYIAVFGFMVIMSFTPGVAWSGHVGGLLVGIIMGMQYKKKIKGKAQQGKYGYRFG